MSFAYWCIMVAAILPYFWVILAKAGKQYNNAAPRPQLEQAEGYRKRAFWAQLNAFEAFPPFAAAVIVAQMHHVAQATVDIMALSFIAARVLHAVFYLLNLSSLRSLAWAMGFALVIGLFILSAQA